MNKETVSKHKTKIESISIEIFKENGKTIKNIMLYIQKIFIKINEISKFEKSMQN